MLVMAVKCKKCGEKAVFPKQLFKHGPNGFPLTRMECGKCGDYEDGEMTPVRWAPEGAAWVIEETI